jgi:hypothetical protein
LLGYVGD